MVISKSKDVMLFYQLRKDCSQIYYDVDFPVCKSTGRLCDEDVCPIVKKADFIDDFIHSVKSGGPHV